ncbi:single-stranded DNA-binding protein [Pararobbsia silviterrae]|uniref:Single-stranded DNA-binding protein n=1 Tax=Pararobbsia silviterrae TaxID=1792498 RepID=A0A494X8K5_9BURK|nr:single-stranded DNA-binding protein [Pararobbsia silviterrae]RKP44706.1 single-stranded DNA-binding protein [Pararobbsia silviterrae]
MRGHSPASHGANVLSLNRCTFIGNLGADPEVRYMQSGEAIATFRIGVTDRYKDKQSGDQKEITEWIRCQVFGRYGEIAGEHLKKGQQVYVEGKWRTRKWQDQSGKDIYSTELRVDSFQMLGGARSSGGANDDREERSNNPAPPRGGKPKSSGYGDIPDDDIPFMRPAAVDGIPLRRDGAARY